MLTGVQEIDQQQLKQLSRFYIRTGKNFITLGPAGIGKTEMAFQASTEEQYEYCYLNLSTLEAPDLNGLPHIMEEVIDGKTMRYSGYVPPRMFPQAGFGLKKKVLIVDELDKAKEELQNPMLELFQFRSINGHKFDIHAVLATGNLPDENAFSRTLSHALTNRCALFKVTHSYEPWRDWAVQNNVNPLIVAFLAQNTEQLLMKEAEGDETAYCSRSPRSWTQAAKDVDDAPDLDVDFQTMLVAGRVGQTGASSFKVWLEHYRHIEPVIRNLVSKGEMPNVSAMNLDRLLVCAVGAADAIMRKHRAPAEKGQDKKKGVREVATRVGKFLKSLDSEIAICALKSTLDLKVISDNELVNEKDFMEVYLKIKKAEKES
jgi:hypothetical protein